MRILSEFEIYAVIIGKLPVDGMKTPFDSSSLPMLLNSWEKTCCRALASPDVVALFNPRVRGITKRNAGMRQR